MPTFSLTAKKASGIARLLGPSKFQSAPGGDNPCYAAALWP